MTDKYPYNRQHQGIIPRTRAEAESQNVFYYYPKEPCSKGHIFAQFSVKNDECQECAQIQIQKAQETAEAIRAKEVNHGIAKHHESRELGSLVKEVWEL